MNDNTITPIDSPVIAGSTNRNMAFTPEIAMFYTVKANSIKTEVDKMAAEVHQRQDRMRLINDLIADLNNITDDKHQLDLNQHPDIQEKLRVAEELGVKVIAGQLQYNSVQRDRLIENLHLCADNWDKQNKTSTQKMDIQIKELDRIMMLLKEVQKTEKQTIHSAIAGVKGV